MSYIDIIILAFAMSIDACIVAFSYGLVFEKEKLKNALSLGICTGIFQGIMPVIGYFLTGLVKTYIQPYASLILFLIFTYLGVKFIIESFEKEKNKDLCIDFKCLFLVGVATSIDAFSSGISLALMGNRILKPALLIAFITFMNANIGYFIGNKFRCLPTRFLEIFAGSLLIFLGIKALF